MKNFRITILALLSCALLCAPAHCETREQWIELGARVHGAFGAFIPVGIRIGLDAREQLKADPRGLTVVYYSGEKPPCPCIADGVMLATVASPGQGTLQISPEKAPPGFMAVVIIRNRKTGQRGHQLITLKGVLPTGEEPDLVAFLEKWQPKTPQDPRKEMLR